MARSFHMLVFVAMVAASISLHGSSAQTTHVVGDALGWLVPPGGDIAYSTWASMKTFTVGDTLVFNFTSGVHNVAEVSKEAFDSCNTTTPISISTNSPTNIALRSSGEHYFICTFTRHCGLGQKLAIKVLATSSTSPPPAATPSPSPVPAATTPASVATPVPSPSRGSQTHTVGDKLGWTVPPGGPIAYQTWASNKDFMVGDVLVFNFVNGAHNVAEVTKTAYDSCNTSSPITTTTTSPARININKEGEHYYICTFQGHCSLGQMLSVNVSGDSTETPPPPLSGSAAPSNRSTPSETSPPGNSAPTFAGVAALPVTFLCIALALLY